MAKTKKPKNVSVSPLVNRHLDHPMGAYKWHKLYDDSICEYVPDLYIGGKTDCEVACAIGVSEKTLQRWVKEYPLFADAVEYGRTLSKMHMSGVGREAAEGTREIDSKVWHLFMRNCHGWDDDKDVKEKINELQQTVDIIKQSALKQLPQYEQEA